MTNLTWLDDVRKWLVRNALPPSYIQRFIGELSDHLEDLKEEIISTNANVCSRLGQPEQVAEAVVVAYQRRTFLGRHPVAAFLVFAVSSPVSLIALISLAIVGWLVFDEACNRLGGTDHLLMPLRKFEPATSLVLPYVLSLLTVVIPCTLASIFSCKLAKRLRIGRKWMLLSCAILGVTALPFWFAVELSDIPGQSRVMCRLGIPQSIGHIGELPNFILWDFCHFLNVIQFLVPLAIGWWFMRRKPRPGPDPTCRVRACLKCLPSPFGRGAGGEGFAGCTARCPALSCNPPSP